jgi:hypothetical protein
VRPEGLGKLKKNHLIRYQTRDLPVCSVKALRYRGIIIIFIAQSLFSVRQLRALFYKIEHKAQYYWSR